MSKESNSQYLLEVKHEYSRQLCNLLVPVMYEGIHSIYSEATKNKKDTPMKIFQILLSRIPQWNQHIITNEYQRILNKTQCDFIADLITAVFISHAKILSSVKSKKKSKTLNLKVPNGDYFIHKAYIECARHFWKNPYLFCDNISTIEYQRNMREAESIIEQSINETVRKLLPVKNILQQYINLDESSSSSSDSSSSSESSSNNDEDTEKEKKKKKKKKSNKYGNESDTDPDAIITKESMREKQYITNNMTERDKKQLEKLVKTTLASTPKDVSIIEPTDIDGCFSTYSIGNNDAPINEFTTEIFDTQNQKQDEPTANIKTVVLSPNNSFMNGVEEITLNDFNIDTDCTNMDINLCAEPIDINTNFNEPFPMEITEMNLNETFPMEITETNLNETFPMEINEIEPKNNINIDISMPEPIIDIFPEIIQTEPSIEKKNDTLLPKPSSIMSDMRSMNSRIDEKLERENDTVSSKKTGTASKSASVSIKQQEIPEQQHIKNITITQSNDTPTQTRQPNLKKKTDTSLNTQTQTPPPAPTGGANPKYSFF
jgi:hypothetical protein